MNKKAITLAVLSGLLVTGCGSILGGNSHGVQSDHWLHGRSMNKIETTEFLTDQAVGIREQARAAQYAAEVEKTRMAVGGALYGAFPDRHTMGAHPTLNMQGMQYQGTNAEGKPVAGNYMIDTLRAMGQGILDGADVFKKKGDQAIREYDDYRDQK